MANIAPDNISLRQSNASRISIGGDSIPRSQEGVDDNDVECSSNYARTLSSGAPSVHEGDFKEKQEFKGWVFLWLVYQSVGTIYGDIGTSPLYVYSSTFNSDPSYEDLLGALSIIIWALTLIVTIQYVLIVLRADDQGGGGSFALYSLLCRFSNISGPGRNSERRVRIGRFPNNELRASNRAFRSALESSRLAGITLKVVAVLGICLMIADGILTPAQSVLGAIQGLWVVAPDISSSTIVGVSCAILVILFLLQPFGTTKVSGLFAPIVIVWLLLNAAFGIYNLAVHDHSVLKAFSPYYAGSYLARRKTEGWQSLGGILLAFTGVEAMYANIEAFEVKAIQVSWTFFAYPCLLLAYIGQAAYISKHPLAYTNPFFNSLPPGMLWPGIVISTLAAGVASQAVITAVFQLISQVMSLSYFPNLKLVHTSERFRGQIYIPLANWLLMIGTVIVTVIYRNTKRLGHAYGLCVVMVIFITTCLVSIIAVVVWRVHPVIALPIFLIFITLDGLFLSSSLTKVPEGAWFTLMLTAVISVVVFVWRYGKENQWAIESSTRSIFSQLVLQGDNGELFLSDSYGGGEVTTLRGVGIFFDKAGEKSPPPIYTRFLHKFRARHELTVIFHLHIVPKPRVEAEEEHTVTYVSEGNYFRVHVRQGFKERDNLVKQDLDMLIKRWLVEYLTQHYRQAIPNIVQDGMRNHDENQPSDLNAIRMAFVDKAVYVVGHDRLRVGKKNGMLRRVVLGTFIWLRELSRSKIADIEIPIDNLIEIGFVKEM